ncbi:TIM barrel protein [Samsonia erythrinae]|uniref:2-keto-myo-inositol isomerase n=1 Tax=Samsonia erythrinae TaxID=160434 RepID=A0A4R3VQE9_9GAMM|nr:TIM barrel protein [Samsonia erythrinae]TCV09334.1 2-keto-myo-inositol isomerase [Samsonia erythrinae]
MAIALQRFCINRKIAPALSIEAFFRLVNSLGLNKVELRNDLPGGKVTDDLSHQQVLELAERYQIDILTINAVYPFNCRTEQVRQLTESLLKEAKAIGAKALVMCPLNEGVSVPASETLNAMRDLAPLYAAYGVEALVEPLGFPQSSLRSAAQAQALIHDAGVPFKLLIDTFHHHLYPQADEEFSQINVDEIGLVHLSGVEDTRPREKLTDDERIMLTSQDRLFTCAQIKNLEARGYRGVYAFEPFAPELVNWREADIRREIEQSIALIQQHVD